MKFVQLTAPDGDPVFVNPEAVQIVRVNNTGEAQAGKSILVLASGGIQAVLEVPTVAVSRLEGHRD
jgi:hypothetical protein